jgi:hypothetical protein
MKCLSLNDMQKNTLTKLHILTSQISGKLKKMRENLKNDCGLHLHAENLLKKNLRLGE